LKPGGGNGIPGGAPGKPGGLKPGGGPPGIPGGPNGMGGRWSAGAPIGGIIPIPRPAGIPRPGPTGRAFFLSSSWTGGGPSTDKLTTVSPRRMTKPSVRFISCMGPASVSPGFFLGRIRLNSSHSASTRFMCLSNASIWPTKARPSLMVTLSRQFTRLSILPPFDFGGGCKGVRYQHLCLEDIKRPLTMMGDGFSVKARGCCEQRGRGEVVGRQIATNTIGGGSLKRSLGLLH